MLLTKDKANSTAFCLILISFAMPAHAHGDMTIAAIGFGSIVSHAIALAVALLARTFKVARLFVVAVVLIPIVMSWLWLASIHPSHDDYWIGLPLLVCPWLTLAFIWRERLILAAKLPR